MTEKMIAIKKEMEVLNKAANDLMIEEFELGKDYQKELLKYIKENNLLNKYKWFFEMDRDLRPHLCSPDEEDGAIGDLILIGGPHYSLELEPLISFCSNDGELSIRFGRDANFAKFIDEWKIEVDYSTIDKNIKELENRLNSLKEIKKAH